VRIHDSLRQRETGRQPSPSEAIIDSQSIKSAAMLSQDVGFDGEMDANDFERRYLGVGTTSVLSLQMLANAKVVNGTQTSQPDGAALPRLGRWWV